MTCFKQQSYTIFECLFIFSVSKLLLTPRHMTAKFGRQLHDDHVQTSVGFCVYRGRRYQKMTF